MDNSSEGEKDIQVLKVHSRYRRPPNTTRVASGKDDKRYALPVSAGSSPLNSKNNLQANRRLSWYESSALSEEEKARILREEISRESVSLQRLEQLAQELPKLSNRSAVPRRSDNSYLLENRYTADHANGSGGGAGNNWASTSRVIENLQATVDTLRRELRDQTEIAKEERNGREALRKRSDIMDSTLEVLKHQNEMLNRLLDRKERRINELEDHLVQKNNKIDLLEEVTINNAGMKQTYEHKLQKSEEEKIRLETSYTAMTESLRQLKEKYHNDLTAIGDRITTIQLDRQADIANAHQLEELIKQQGIEKQAITELEQEASQLRLKHIRHIESIFRDIGTVVEMSDDSMNKKVKSTLLVIDEMERKYVELSADSMKNK
jgi:DNA repair exonuclease SbcCD ATPase subunit